jgi:hypothetical protein
MDEHPAVGIAIVLIAVGVFLLLSNLGVFRAYDLSIDDFWPGLLVLGGLAFWLQFLLGSDHDPGLAFVGTAALLLGAFFFLITLNARVPFENARLGARFDWGDNQYLWPVYPLVGGIAFILLGLLDRDWGAFGLGLVAVVVGAVALPFTLGIREDTEKLVQYWPLLLILIGVMALLRAAIGAARSR